MTKEIYLIRHGETTFNKLGIVQGSGVDTDLNETGKQQAQAFYNTYEKIPFEVVLTSALQRTHQTVKPFTDAGLTWEKFPEINEMSWGEQEGKERTPEMKATFKIIIDEWAKGNYDVGLKDGENINQVVERCQTFVEQLKNRAEKTLLICAHGRLNRCLLCVLLNVPLTHMDDFEHTNTGLYRLRFKENKFHLLSRNNIEHLETQELTTT